MSTDFPQTHQHFSKRIARAPSTNRAVPYDQDARGEEYGFAFPSLRGSTPDHTIDFYFETGPPPTVPVGRKSPGLITIRCNLLTWHIGTLAAGRYKVLLDFLDENEFLLPPTDGTWVCQDTSQNLCLKDFNETTLTATCCFSGMRIHRSGRYTLLARLIHNFGAQTDKWEPETTQLISTTRSPWFMADRPTGFLGQLASMENLSTPFSEVFRKRSIDGQAPESSIRDSDAENETRKVLEENSAMHTSCTVFWVDLDLPRFVLSELPTDQALSSMLTVSGTPEKAFSMTCKEYVETFWPTVGPKLLEMFISNIQESHPRFQALNGSPRHPNGGSIMVWTGIETIVAAKGSKSFAAEVAELLRWFTATFNPCKEGNLQFSDSLIRHGHDRGYFEILQRIPLERGATETVATCWHRMFEGFNLAVGFPIPERSDEKGVELPFQAMKLLGLIWHPCHYDGKVFLKGDETALLPIASTSDNCIQWHFVQTDEGDSESLWDLIKESGDVMTDLSHIRNLSEKRMFVGYWPNAEIHLGTRTSGFRSVELSGAQYNDKNRIILGDEITGTFGTSGMGFFTAEVSATVQLHQTANRRIMAAHKRIHDKIRNAKQALTLIYDVGTKRAWLVPELSVVLHMILVWASYQDQAEDVLDKMPYAMPHHHGGEAAYEAIKSAMGSELPAHIQTDEVNTFSHLLVEFFARITYIKDQQIGAKSRETKDLIGYEFKEICEFQEHIASKRATIDTTKSAGWPKLIASRPDIAVLFCSGLVDPIQPTPKEPDCCLTWSEIPKEQYFLTASMPCVRQLSQQCGGGDSLKVYNDLYCVPGNATSWSIRNLCREGHSPCYQSLLEMSNQPPKGSYAYSETGAIVVGKVQTNSLKLKFGKAKWCSSMDFRRIIGIGHDEKPGSTTTEASEFE